MHLIVHHDGQYLRLVSARTSSEYIQLHEKFFNSKICPVQVVYNGGKWKDRIVADMSYIRFHSVNLEQTHCKSIFSIKSEADPLWLTNHVIPYITQKVSMYNGEANNTIFDMLENSYDTIQVEEYLRECVDAKNRQSVELRHKELSSFHGYVVSTNDVLALAKYAVQKLLYPYVLHKRVMEEEPEAAGKLEYSTVESTCAFKDQSIWKQAGSDLTIAATQDNEDEIMITRANGQLYTKNPVIPAQFVLPLLDQQYILTTDYLLRLHDRHAVQETVEGFDTNTSYSFIETEPTKVDTLSYKVIARNTLNNKLEIVDTSLLGTFFEEYEMVDGTQMDDECALKVLKVLLENQEHIQTNFDVFMKHFQRIVDFVTSEYKSASSNVTCPIVKLYTKHELKHEKPVDIVLNELVDILGPNATKETIESQLMLCGVQKLCRFDGSYFVKPPTDKDVFGPDRMFKMNEDVRLKYDFRAVPNVSKTYTSPWNLGTRRN